MASLRALAHAPWSASKVQTALRCPRLFHYRYVDRVPEPEVMPELRMGKAVHAAIEHALNGILVKLAIEEGKKQLDETDDIDRYEALCERIPAFLGRIEEFSRRRKLNRRFVEYQMAVKTDFGQTQFYSPDAFYRGIMDVAYVYDDVNLAMVDHKSGQRYPNMNIADQLEGYAVLAALCFRHVKRIWLGVHWVVDAEVVWTPSRTVAEINQSLVPKVMNNIEAAALAVGDGPRPNPSSWCERCGYRSICPAGREVRYEPVDQDPDPWLYDD